METDPLVERLTTLLQLEERAREAESAVHLGFIMVNETLHLVPYRQAILWTSLDGITALSGVPVVDHHIPMVQWANRVCRHLHQTASGMEQVEAPRLPPADGEEWAEWLPPCGLWLPLGRMPVGGLLLARDTPWHAGECYLLERLAHAYGHAWASLFRPTTWQRLGHRLAHFGLGSKLLILTLVAGLLALPVKLTVLAPGDMVPAHPVVIRAPLEGVIDEIHVQPNQTVAKDDLLFRLDPTNLQSKLEVAGKVLATAEAEYRQAIQQAVWDANAKSQLKIIAARIEERKTEVDYLKTLLARIQVKAPEGGVVVFDDPSAWLGRPVAMGEKVMVVTGIQDTELEGWLAIGDDIDLAPGAPVVFFPNTNPLQLVHARLRYLSYEAFPRPNGTLAFRLRATVEGTDKPRVGLKGTARIDGESVTLAYWLLRKPWALLRQSIGL